MIQVRDNISYEQWLDETFGRAVTGESYPQFEDREVADWPDPLTDSLALAFLTRLFEDSEDALRYYSDRQITAGLWELGPGDIHSVYNRELPVDDRERLIASVANFFQDFFDGRCVPRLSNSATEHVSPLNTICYMWWEVIHMGGAADDPDADRLNAAGLQVLREVLALPNPACKEAALHGLGHMASRDGRAKTIIDDFLINETSLTPELEQYARAASCGCIQ